MAKAEKIHAIGRRKTAVARVYLSEGKGNIIVNGRPVKEYFGETTVYSEVALQPLSLVQSRSKFDLQVTVRGGGLTGQADAICLAIARALCLHELKTNPLATSQISSEDEEGSEGEAGIVSRPVRALLKANKLLTSDARKVERKLYGYRKARKKEQYSKR